MEKIKCTKKELSNMEVQIDRKQENKDVETYQRTKDIEILEKVFKNRIPTLKYWAHKHYFPGIALSIEDFYGELVIVFVKAIKHFKYGRGSFNTCLYTFLLNRVKNIKAGRYAKKRKPELYEGPLSGIMLSLDYTYDGDSSGDFTNTLGERLENEDSHDYEKNVEQINFKDSIDILSDGDPRLKDIFVKIGNGNSISSIIKDFKRREGSVKIDNTFHEKILCSECKKVISEKIKEVLNIDNFKLLEYTVDDNTLNYIIEMRKTDESDLLSKTIRNLKKNKKYYLARIKDEKCDEVDFV